MSLIAGLALEPRVSLIWQPVHSLVTEESIVAETVISVPAKVTPVPSALVAARLSVATKGVKSEAVLRVTTVPAPVAG